jgi:cytochrome c553
MPKYAIAVTLFGIFALGLPLWAMQYNKHSPANTHGCYGECYEAWKAETGGVVALQVAAAAARAEASPEELGQQAYAGCVACHGANGEGGVGPQLAGQSAADIADKLLRYKAGETVGSQSSLMWSQAAMLSEQDIDNIAAFVETL